MTDLVPTNIEKALLGRCMMESGLLIADNVDQVWQHPSMYRALVTWRLCIEAIVELIGGRHGVQASFVKACVLQTEGLSAAPFALEDVAEFLVTDTMARIYWDSLVADSHYPHRCPHCHSAAFVGIMQVDCKARCQTSVPRG